MIAWVDDQCRAWGRHRRWILLAKDTGWPERSILGRLIEEGPGAGHGEYRSRLPYKEPPEAYTLVSVALQRMAATHELAVPFDVINLHYVLDGKAKEKAPILGVSVKQYWSLLHTAHAFIAGFEVPRETKVTVNGVNGSSVYTKSLSTAA